MKNIAIIVWLLLFGVVGGWGQENYIRLTDASGIPLSASELAELESVSQQLVSVVDDYSGTPGQFKVFDFGFYAHQESFEGGFPDAFQLAVTEVSTISPYHLLFGRQTDQSGINSKVWVDINLPETGEFECLDFIPNHPLQIIYDEVFYEVNDYQQGFYNADNEKNAIEKLTQLLNTFFGCCDPHLKSNQECGTCIAEESTNDGNVIYSTRKIHSKLDELGFDFSLVEILVDNEYESPNTFTPGLLKSGISSQNILAQIKFHDEDAVDSDFMIDQMIDNETADISTRFNYTLSTSKYVFKFPRDCGLFNTLWVEYQNDPAEFCVFVVLINWGNDYGLIGYHVKNSYSNSFQKAIIRYKNNNDDFSSDYEAIDSIQNLEDICENYLLSIGDRFQYEVDYFLSGIYFSKKDEEYFKDHYKNKESRTRENLTEARLEYQFYVEKEYAILRAEGSWKWTGWIRARYKVCRRTIHTILDACGLIEGFGAVCDGTNAVLYYLSGDKTNATLSAVGILPVVGTGSGLTKLGGKVLKFESVKVHINFSYKQVGHFVHFVGGANKLKKTMEKVQFTSTFTGVTRKVGDALTEAHHVFPTALTKAGARQLSIFKRLARYGWHSADPWMNGLVLPKKLANGLPFHGNHPKYTDWVEDALRTIDAESTDDLLMSNMNALKELLQSKMEYAYNNNIKLNDYFKELMDPKSPNLFKMEDLL